MTNTLFIILSVLSGILATFSFSDGNTGAGIFFGLVCCTLLAVAFLKSKDKEKAKTAQNAPKLMNGDIVFIRKQPEVNDGQIAAVLIEDEATLKRVYYDKPNNVLSLVAENPKYRPFIYSGEQLDHIRILGRAVSLYRRIK